MDDVEKRREKLKKWLKGSSSIYLIAILVFALILRIYLFYNTAGQTLWWDEAEYMATAKHWAFGVPYDLNPQRPPLFQFLAAILFKVGLGESFIKFTISLIPSVFLIFCIYLLGKEMFDEKIGLIAAFCASISWTFLFWSTRMQPDFLSMSCQTLAVWYMWKYWKGDMKVHSLAALSGVFVALGFYFKISALLVPMIFMVFIALMDRLSAFKKKGYYIFSGAFLATLIPYFIWSWSTFGNLFASKQGYTPDSLQFPIGWYNFKFYSMMTDGLIGVLFILFLIGVILAFRFVLYLDVLVKHKKRVFDPGLFSLLSLAFISAFYIFYIKNTDDRWVFLWMPFIFMLVGVATVFIYKMIRPYGKAIAVIVVIALLGFATYGQIVHAKMLDENKKGSYAPVKDASLWIKENSLPNDKVLSISYTQSVYYTERNVSTYSTIYNTTAFEDYLQKNKPQFIQVSIFEPHPTWILQSGTQNGYQYVALPYFNSSIVTQNGQLASLDLKPEVKHDGITFTLVYPREQIDWAFVYRITYQ
ncbi:glycosyltransferase family 39 protein [Candidatus Pacearchaeota archaeon]|nr:glycosyltransferase family 39 protein [Candidatus Pacearchaeota archaeon]